MAKVVPLVTVPGCGSGFSGCRAEPASPGVASAGLRKVSDSNSEKAVPRQKGWQRRPPAPGVTNVCCWKGSDAREGLGRVSVMECTQDHSVAVGDGSPGHHGGGVAWGGAEAVAGVPAESGATLWEEVAVGG